MKEEEKRGNLRSLLVHPSFLFSIPPSFRIPSEKKTKDMRENEKRIFLLFLFFISPSLYPSLLSLPSQDFTVAKEENETKIMSGEERRRGGEDLFSLILSQSFLPPSFARFHAS